ncbi:hypothetical protein K466DRAFT_601891 [Polyporus arcularius HHB13444]|uniref:Uncharacterized protein n=1 Tax=Polyporus arcularius HHB13444 TaxID=1314778 RepID=A0A5C3P8L2_9APHY|nr:hypothetical protein K466DRAFT_601891 [Polyporus arcularius HHB13444]
MVSKSTTAQPLAFDDRLALTVASLFYDSNWCYYSPTMTSARGRKRSRPDAADIELQASDKQPVEETTPDSSLPPPEHRYGTRRSTQAAHPGVAAGLAKRFKADIQAEANKKKAVEAAKKAKEEKRQEVKAAREHEGARRTAAMQDRRARQEVEEIDFMEQTPPPLDDDLEGDDQDDVDFNPLNPLDGSDHGGNFSPSEDDSTHSQVLGTTLQKPPPKSKGKSKATADEHEEGPPPSKKLSEAERRERRVRSVREPILELRKVHIGHEGESSGRPSTTSTSKKPAKSAQGDAFTADFRHRIRSGQVETGRRNSSRQPANHNDNDIVFSSSSCPKVPSAALDDSQDAWLQETFSFIPDQHGASPLRQRQLDTPLPEEVIGGFSDADVASRPPASRKSTDLVFRGPAKNNMVGVVANSVIEGDAVVSPSKKSRAPKKRLTGALSRAFEALPSWIQDTMISVIIPSLIKFYGAQDNPWSNDGENHKFRTVLKALLRKLHPGREDELQRGDAVWKFARQGLSDWRSRIMKTAIRIVQLAAKARGSTVAISMWASNALAKGGEATYSQPNTKDPRAARGASQSPYLVQLLAVHYEAAEGAVLDVGYPVGALSMATVAIRRAFQTMATGTFIASSDEFSEDNYGVATKKVREGAVQGLLDHTHRFDVLVATAMSQVPSYKASQAEAASRVEEDDDAYNAVDPPTSPPAENQY